MHGAERRSHGEALAHGSCPPEEVECPVEPDHRRADPRLGAGPKDQAVGCRPAPQLPRRRCELVVGAERSRKERAEAERRRVRARHHG
jgi:hypothetical protein